MRDERLYPVGRAFLTERQAEALILLAQGNSDKQIACEMSCSQNSAREIVATIYRKIGACNRAVAGVLAAKAGLV